MPELPEVETTRRGIQPWLEGHTIKRIRVHNASLRWLVPKTIHQLEDQRIESIQRRGKYLLLACKIGTAIIHLGMSGSLRICEPSSARRKHDHVEFFLSGDKTLRYHDPRRFGCVLWYTGDVMQHALLSSLGPEPLSEAFNTDYLKDLTRNRKVAIKNLIMNSHIVVGVGNIYASEALFKAGVRPTRPAYRVTKVEIGKLIFAIKDTLAQSIAQGGTTLKDFVNSDGNPGYFAQSLNVYGRLDEPCPNCATAVKSKIIGQRASFYCPACQK